MSNRQIYPRQTPKLLLRNDFPIHSSNQGENFLLSNPFKFMLLSLSFAHFSFQISSCEGFNSVALFVFSCPLLDSRLHTLVQGSRNPPWLPSLLYSCSCMVRGLHPLNQQPLFPGVLRDR
ncbi:hypothetical protein AQUCO_00100454v1 [Aquilegia coerulea]|uniref:Uncharacterized protein n=1 Tax=Aquilegia coerulea TaxID=218851 RepID=A0A2G5FAF1_AQUCA|nr:hypothetical protein AQUCO_00100454v1 [Aquilegia coerulea]